MMTGCIPEWENAASVTAQVRRSVGATVGPRSHPSNVGTVSVRRGRQVGRQAALWPIRDLRDGWEGQSIGLFLELLL